ncbi:hypothetical protein [Haloquadratum walsbyi]|uniref:Uncharacterized protein n=1 Tax=Haloquadratum walsbyi J07HQW2 TaxID=1238425 RepID=U1PJ89_9EURY|nr:hypothetical protein [Haloquadratum walsbyi]ERG93732.1 MAG: hypothetical protein J07HQW2_00166 [Haloquadratum walsbyi J07HQW2]
MPIRLGPNSTISVSGRLHTHISRSNSGRIKKLRLVEADDELPRQSFLAIEEQIYPYEYCQRWFVAVPVTFGFVGEVEHSDPDGRTWWMRLYSDDTEQMGLVTCSDALPKLYEDTTE